MTRFRNWQGLCSLGQCWTHFLSRSKTQHPSSVSILSIWTQYLSLNFLTGGYIGSRRLSVLLLWSTIPAEQCKHAMGCGKRFGSQQCREIARRGTAFGVIRQETLSRRKASKKKFRKTLTHMVAFKIAASILTCIALLATQSSAQHAPEQCICLHGRRHVISVKGYKLTKTQCITTVAKKKFTQNLLRKGWVEKINNIRCTRGRESIMDFIIVLTS